MAGRLTSATLDDHGRLSKVISDIIKFSHVPTQLRADVNIPVLCQVLYRVYKFFESWLKVMVRVVYYTDGFNSKSGFTESLQSQIPGF